MKKQEARETYTTHLEQVQKASDALGGARKEQEEHENVLAEAERAFHTAHEEHRIAGETNDMETISQQSEALKRCKAVYETLRIASELLNDHTNNCRVELLRLQRGSLQLKRDVESAVQKAKEAIPDNYRFMPAWVQELKLHNAGAELAALRENTQEIRETLELNRREETEALAKMKDLEAKLNRLKVKTTARNVIQTHMDHWASSTSEGLDSAVVRKVCTERHNRMTHCIATQCACDTDSYKDRKSRGFSTI